jgi:hypothetical protein
MASIKDKIDRAITAYETAKKAKAGAEASRQYNTTLSELAKLRKNAESQNSSKR